MNFIVKEARNIVYIFLALFLYSYFFMDMSFPFLILFLIVAFLFFDPERELLDFNDDVLVSPADMIIDEIKLDEENRQINLICKKSIYNQSVLRVMQNAEKIDLETKKGIINTGDENSKATIVDYKNGVKVIFKNGLFAQNVKINSTNDLTKGQRFGFMFDGEIQIILPYNARLMMGLKDKILANTPIARLGE